MANAYSYQLELTLPDNFDLFEHIKDLKTQGFYFLSFLIEHKEILSQPIKTKELAAKLNFHVSTIRRWLKKLIALKYIKKIIEAVTADKRARHSVCEKQEAKPSVAHSAESTEKSDGVGTMDPALSANPASRDLIAIRDDSTQDPLENFLDNLRRFERVLLQLQIKKLGLKVQPEDTIVDQIKMLSCTRPEFLSTVNELYQARLKEASS